MTPEALETFLWQYGTKKIIANMEINLYKGGSFFEGIAPPKSLQKSVDIDTILVSGNKVYSLQQKLNNPTDTIYYLHGGGFTCGMSMIQWDIIGYLIDKLNYKVIVPDYPLVPDVNYKDIYAFIVDIYKYISDIEGRLFVVGDSAGASLVLGLSQYIKKDDLRMPEHLVLISPWMDVSMKNPQIAAIQPLDPTLDVRGLDFIAKLYSDGNYKNPLVSPIYGDYSKVCPMTLLIGTRDILYPDCKLFNEKCISQNIPLSYYAYKNMVHLFPLFDTPQGNEAKSIIIDALQ